MLNLQRAPNIPRIFNSTASNVKQKNTITSVKNVQSQMNIIIYFLFPFKETFR